MILREPKYRLHKARNCAVVTIAGQDYYLGEFDSPASWEQCHRLVAESLAVNLVSDEFSRGSTIESAMLSNPDSPRRNPERFFGSDDTCVATASIPTLREVPSRRAGVLRVDKKRPNSFHWPSRPRRPKRPTSDLRESMVND